MHDSLSIDTAASSLEDKAVTRAGHAKLELSSGKIAEGT